MLKTIRIDGILVSISILTCILLIHSGHAQRRNLFESNNGDILSSISNNGRRINQIPDKLQPSWSCIILGEPGCLGTCNLMSALYGCDVSSSCRKGIYCECNEIYHFQQREVPAKNFQNLPLNELWNYRFQQSPESMALLTQIVNDDEKRDYTSSLLRDAHITGEDVIYLLGDEYPQLGPQLQRLVVNPHGLKSELGVNGQLEYDNIGDYFSDLFQRIKKKVSEKMESAKSKRRILELIRNIDDEEDLQYIMRQILLSGDDKLYNFVSCYLRRNGHPIEDESLYQPRRRFGRRRRGCRKRKRCGGRGGWGDMDYDSPPGGAWHGRPLKRKIIITHNDATIKIDADEDEVIEIALINELKKAEEKAGATPSGLEVSKQQQMIPPPPPNLKLTNSASPQGNTYLEGTIPGLGNAFSQGMIPSQGNTYMQGTMPFTNTPSQLPLMQDKTELYSMVPPEINYARPTMSAPMQGNNLIQEAVRPQIPILSDLQESYSITKPINSITPTNIVQHESLAPLMANVPQVPSMQQVQQEITRPQMRPMPLELPTPTSSQYNSFVTDNMPSVSMTNAVPLMHQMEEILTPPPQMQPSLHIPSAPSSEYSVIQEVIPMAQIPTMYSKEDISVSPLQMRPIPLTSSQNNVHIQETPVLTSSTVQPFMQKIEEVIPQPSQMKPVFNEVPFSSYSTLMQDTLPTVTPGTMGNTLGNILTYNDMEVQPLLMNQEIIKQNMDYLPQIETNQSYSSVKPILEVENTLSNLPSTTTFYADQSELRPSIVSETINSPQTVYEYINSAQNVPSLNYDLENATPSRMSSSNYNFGDISSPRIPSPTDLENISPPSMSSLNYDFGTSNMANQLGSQFQNAMSNLPSSSLTSYINQIGLPQNSYSFQTSSLPSVTNISNMEWMSTPSTFSTMSSNLGSMLPQSSWLSQTSNVIPQNDNLSSTSTNGLNWLQENAPSFKESIPSSQITTNSLIHDDTPRYIQLSPGNSDEEFRVNKIQKVSESGFNGSQNIKNEIEVADNFTTNTIQQASEMLQSEQNVGSNMVSLQQGIAQSIPDPAKKKKSLFYMVIDDTGNVVHSASVDHEAEREKQAASQTSSAFPFISNYFSQRAPGESKPQNYGWPYWSK